MKLVGEMAGIKVHDMGNDPRFSDVRFRVTIGDSYVSVDKAALSSIGLMLRIVWSQAESQKTLFGKDKQ